MKNIFILGNLLFLSAILSAQNVGVGTVTPASKLDVNGGVTIGSTYSGVNAAPANGAIIQGQMGVGTNAPDPSAAPAIRSIK